MSFLSNLNFASTVISFGCISFATSNFGIKFGRAITFSNPSGYKYISDSDHKKKIYESIMKTNKPSFVKDAWQLEQWCKKHQKKARKWKDTSEYCLIKNNVRHQLLNKGFTLKEAAQVTPNTKTEASTTTQPANAECTPDLFDSYADETESSVGYLFAKIKCVENKNEPVAATVTASPKAASAPNGTTSSGSTQN